MFTCFFHDSLLGVFGLVLNNTWLVLLWLLTTNWALLYLSCCDSRHCGCRRRHWLNQFCCLWLNLEFLNLLLGRCRNWYEELFTPVFGDEQNGLSLLMRLLVLMRLFSCCVCHLSLCRCKRRNNSRELGLQPLHMLNVNTRRRLYCHCLIASWQ